MAGDTMSVFVFGQIISLLLEYGLHLKVSSWLAHHPKAVEKDLHKDEKGEYEVLSPKIQRSIRNQFSNLLHNMVTPVWAFVALYECISSGVDVKLSCFRGERVVLTLLYAYSCGHMLFDLVRKIYDTKVHNKLFDHKAISLWLHHAFIIAFFWLVMATDFDNYHYMAILFVTELAPIPDSMTKMRALFGWVKIADPQTFLTMSWVFLWFLLRIPFAVLLLGLWSGGHLELGSSFKDTFTAALIVVNFILQSLWSVGIIHKVFCKSRAEKKQLSDEEGGKTRRKYSINDEGPVNTRKSSNISV